MNDPFESKHIDYILRLKNSTTLSLKTRESTRIEFKESFNWSNKSKYAKTMAAFANNDGGYIVFGISDSPRHIVGLNSNRFEEIDEEKITSYLNENFSPEILWMKEVIEVHGKRVGLIYVAESNNKPVMCSKGDRDTKEADIYYRYSGRSERIKYPELKKVLSLERHKEKELWMKHMQKIAKIGVDNVALLDIDKGKFEGENGTLLIEQDIVKEIEFIREGEFKERTGAKTLKLVGEVREFSGIVLPTRTKLTVVRTREIMEALLHGKLHEGMSSEEYLKQLPFERSRFMPIFIFIKLGGLYKEQVIQIFREANTTAVQLKQGLINRLEEQKNYAMGTYIDEIVEEGLVISEIDDFKTYIDSKDSYKNDYTRSLLFNLLLSDKNYKINDFIPEYYKRIIECITHLNKSQIDGIRPLIAEIMMKIYDDYYTVISPKFRNTVCYIDELLYKE